MNQIIITRRDLKLPLHEEISEACNAASDFMYKYEQHRHVQRWKREFGAGKVSVGIDSERELLLLCDKAEGLGVPFMKSFNLVEPSHAQL